MIVWDKTKRGKHLKNHGIDLAEVACVFDAPMVTVVDARAPTSKPSTFSKKQMTAAIAAAPDKVTDSECPYDPNDAASVKAF